MSLHLLLVALQSASSTISFNIHPHIISGPLLKKYSIFNLRLPFKGIPGPVVLLIGTYPRLTKGFEPFKNNLPFEMTFR